MKKVLSSCSAHLKECDSVFHLRNWRTCYGVRQSLQGKNVKGKTKSSLLFLFLSDVLDVP